MNTIKTGILLLCLSGLACQSAKQAEDLASRCCRECREAFTQSPVAVGPEAAQCGEFTTGKPMSNPCSKYFREHPKTVAACE